MDSKVKNGQITIFIIMAFVLVICIIAIFLLIRGVEKKEVRETNPSVFVKDCIKESVEETVQAIMRNGGRINPTQYIMMSDEKYNYLCYQADFYLSCYNTHPMLEEIIENEIREDTKDDVQRCFDEMRQDLESQGFSVEGGSTSYSIDLLPGKIKIATSKKIEINRDGNGETIENFDAVLLSPLYDLVKVSREIVNSESQFCNVEYNGYMILYPQFNITRIDYSDSKLYVVGDRKSGEHFQFAVRSCAFAPGI